MTKKKKRQNIQDQRNIFELLVFRYAPYWPLFVILTVLSLVAAWGYLQVVNPVYEATATLLIKDEKKGVEDTRMFESLNILTSKKIVENEIEVIKSRTLVRETVRILNLCSPVFEDALVLPRPAYSSSPVTVEVSDISQLREEKRVDFKFNKNDSTVTFLNKKYQLNKWVSSPYGTIRFVKNTYLREPGKGPFFVSFIDPRRITDGLLDVLKVQPSNKLTTVVNLSIRDAVPARGENILNTLMDSYNRASTNDKNNIAANTIKFVEERIKLVEKDLDSLERSIELYKSTRGIVDLDEQGKLYLKNSGDNAQKLAELNMQLAVLERAEDYVIKRGSTATIVPSTLGINDERLSRLIQKLYESELQYEGLRKTTAENNPILLSLKSEIENLRPSILENIRNQKVSVLASRRNLTTTNREYDSVLETIPMKERELLEATRQQEIKNDLYIFLLQKREETALSSGSVESDSRLVDRAESSILPVLPNKLLVYGGAVAFAFFLGIARVMLKEVVNNKIMFRSEIEAITNIPIVAEIADSMMKDYVVIDNLKKPFLTEQFLQLRAAVGLRGNSSGKIVMVTSAISGEGKSFISTNLSISLAGPNKRVLLMDADLRNPRISNLYKIGNVAGVAELLHNEVTLEKVIRRTATENLFLLGAGMKRLSAAEFLLDGNIPELFARIREQFDYIIIDTPPVRPVYDAYALSPHCDATLFVVRHGKTPKRILQVIDENMKLRPLTNVSIVFNGVKERGFAKNEDGYGYGQGYGYGYGYVNSKN